MHEFISLDGVIQAPGGKDEDTDGGFEYGGWTILYWDDAIGEKFDETMQGADAMLLGRKTWEIHSVFETMDDPFAQALNAVPKYVVSSTLTEASRWRNSEIISGDVVEAVRKLKEQEGKDILIDGSSVLLHTLLEHDLVDVIQMHEYPLVLGSGKRLFPEGKKIEMELVASKALGSGVVFKEYRVGVGQ